MIPFRTRPICIPISGGFILHPFYTSESQCSVVEAICLMGHSTYWAGGKVHTHFYLIILPYGCWILPSTVNWWARLTTSSSHAFVEGKLSVPFLSTKLSIIGGPWAPTYGPNCTVFIGSWGTFWSMISLISLQIGMRRHLYWEIIRFLCHFLFSSSSSKLFFNFTVLLTWILFFHFDLF